MKTKLCILSQETLILLPSSRSGFFLSLFCIWLVEVTVQLVLGNCQCTVDKCWILQCFIIMLGTPSFCVSESHWLTIWCKFVWFFSRPSGKVPCNWLRFPFSISSVSFTSILLFCSIWPLKLTRDHKKTLKQKYIINTE